MNCSCSITLTDGPIVEDVVIHALPGQSSTTLPSQATLRFLSLVESARVPLYLSTGSPCPVSTSNGKTEEWFRSILLQHLVEDEPSWWETARIDSPLGILTSFSDPDDGSQISRPRVTEILFYLSRQTDPILRPSTPPDTTAALNEFFPEKRESPLVLGVNALALSSDLLHPSTAVELTPPTSPPGALTDLEPVFLQEPFLDEAQCVNRPPVRKRKSAADVFEEADERQKKVRRRGGGGVSAAAASKGEAKLPSLQHHRSNSISQSVPTLTRPLSRSPSLAPSRPATAASNGGRRSALSRMQSVADASEGSDIESKNKDTISRIVMTGMRLYGLSQSKRRKSRASSAVPPALPDDEIEKLELDRPAKDEEFKLIYHQVFKGTCLAFRGSLGTQHLHAFSDVVRDVADRLLSIFCSDPLAKDELETFRPNPALTT